MTAHRRIAFLATAAAAIAAAAVAGVALGHQLAARFESPIPLVDYLVGAGIVVAISFAIVLGGTASVVPPVPPVRLGQTATASGGSTVPRWFRGVLRAAGLVAWVWIVVQELVVGGSSNADVSSLFLWVYGWVGLALVSAFVGPFWSWIDPFSTLHDIGAALLRRLRVGGWDPAPYPERLGRWPAVGGLVFFIWLELVITLGTGGATLAWALVSYTLLTLLLMAQYGRDPWREKGETFGVWFGLLNRLAWLAPDGPPETGRVRRRATFAGLAEPGWSVESLILIALAVGAVLFDGLSQTGPWLDFFGVRGAVYQTALLGGWLALVVAIALAVSRLVGVVPLAAGLLPIALGYIVAHYLTFLLTDGQRIAVAISDPFQQGWDLLGTAFLQSSLPLPAPMVWGIQLAAVVAGHLVGAWTGHAAAARTGLPNLRIRQVPLAALMVVLTVTTLWSLGQKVVEPQQSGAAAGVTVAAPVAVAAPMTVAAPWSAGAVREGL